MADYLNIAGRVRTTAADGVVAEAQEIKDLLKNKSQQEINADVDNELGDRYTKEETYSKEQLDDLITTPDVNYVSVVATDATTAVTDVLPATGEANTIYRVGNWNGTQYDPTMYALFAWNGSAYVCLAVRSFVGEVYDISVNHPDGQGNPTPYADLAAALGTNGANIPADIRRGGMSIKFIQGTVQSSDNKYVQYRLMANEWSTTVADWQGVDTDVTPNSQNLIGSGSVAKYVLDFPKSSQVLINTVYNNTSVEKDLSTNKRYKLLFNFIGYTNTDYESLAFLYCSVLSSFYSTDFKHNFTEDEILELKSNNSIELDYNSILNTHYIGLRFTSGYGPGAGKSVRVDIVEYIDSNAAFEEINNGEFADKSANENSNKLITSGAVYNAAIFEDTNTVTFTIPTRFVTNVKFAVKKDNSYTISVGVSGLSNTDIDNIQLIRLATGTTPNSYKFDHLFTNEDKAALKTDGLCKMSYNAEYDTSYVHLYFVSGYTPTSGNTITVSSSCALTSNDASHRIINGEYADKVPTKDSNKLITSDGVYNATNIFLEAGSNSFEMEGRYNNAIYLPLKNGKTYNLKFSVSGLSNTDIENLQRIRTATGTAAGDYVFDHLFTADEIMALKTVGYCNIVYAAEQDTTYIHLYFVSGYNTPTEGNTITIEAFCNYNVGDVIRVAQKDSVTNFLEGKVCVCFGDSITEFTGRGAGVEKKRYSDYLEEYCNMTTINVGIGGTYLRERHDPVIVEPGVYHISDYGALDMINMVRAACGVDYNESYSYLELAEIAANQIKLYKDSHDDNTPQIARLAAIDWSKVDYVTFLGGTNDWHSGSSLGESGSTDTTTTLGAINEIIRLLLTTYPHIKLMWFTPPVRWIGYNGTEASKIPANFSDFYQINSLTLKEFSNSIKNEVILNHIPICDFYNEMGWNMYNFAQYFGDNETHPFRGNAYIARKIADFLYSH